MIRHAEEYWKRNDSIGTWFVLCQIGKNSSPYYFRAFLARVASGDDIMKDSNHEEKIALKDLEAKEEVQLQMG